jgi:hypothetical protein
VEDLREGIRMNSAKVMLHGRSGGHAPNALFHLGILIAENNGWPGGNYGDFELTCGHQRGESAEHVGTGSVHTAFSLHTMLLRGEVDDGIDAIGGDTKLKSKLDIAVAERVDEGINFSLGCNADPIFDPTAVGNGKRRGR